MAFNGKVIRGARAFMDMNRNDFSKEVGISPRALAQLEDGETSPKAETARKIVEYLHRNNIIYRDNGFEEMDAAIQTYTGQAGMIAFMDDVYDTLIHSSKKEAYVSNVSEKAFEDWLGYEADQRHMARMASIENISYRTLLKEGDTYFSSSQYSQYKWLSDQMFGSVPFYIYGHKLAMIIFSEDNVRIFVHQTPEIAEAYKKQFMNLWENSPEARGLK